MVMRGIVRERIRAQKEGARGHSYIMGAFEQMTVYFQWTTSFLYKIRRLGLSPPAFSLYYSLLIFETFNVTRNHQLFIRWNHQYLHTGIICGNISDNSKDVLFRVDLAAKPADSIDNRRANVYCIFTDSCCKDDGICTIQDSQVLTDVFCKRSIKIS